MLFVVLAPPNPQPRIRSPAQPAAVSPSGRQPRGVPDRAQAPMRTSSDPSACFALRRSTQAASQLSRHRWRQATAKNPETQNREIRSWTQQTRRPQAPRTRQPCHRPRPRSRGGTRRHQTTPATHQRAWPRQCVLGDPFLSASALCPCCRRWRDAESFAQVARRHKLALRQS